jgi:hypothetical protein
VGAARSKFTRAQLYSRWQTGECGTYAWALRLLRPGLRIGVLGNLDDPDSGFDVAHFFAHDDTHAYDSLGRHELPYLGVDNEFNKAMLDINPDHWGCLEDEHGPEDGDEAQRALAAAVRHARRHDVIPRDQEARS